MAELKKHALLLSLMLTLIVFKFVVVPIYEWQEVKLAEIELLTKKKMKIEGVLQQKSSFKENFDLLAAEVAKGNTAFFTFQKEADFKLTQQKLIERMLKKHQIVPSNIGWQVTTPLPEFELLNYQLRVQFSGKTLDLINFIKDTESFSRRIEISDFYISVTNQKNNSLGKSAGWFIINFYTNDTELQHTTSETKV
ncbi:hypothetical protein ACOYR1_03950 [Thalassotalea piscium]